MIPFPYEPRVARILYALAALIVATLVGGLTLGKPNAERTCRLPRWLRLGLSGALLILALIHLVGGAWGTLAELYATLILLGMSCGFLGDLIMSRLLRVPNRLIFGMAAFGVGHLFYAAAFWFLTLQLAAGGFGYLPILLAALCAAVLWVWRGYIRRPGGSKAINLGSLGYAGLIALMVALALNLAIQVSGLVWLAVGAILFLVSDLILGNWQVRGNEWPSVNDVIWTTYVLGQLLIVSSVATALLCLG